MSRDETGQLPEAVERAEVLAALALTAGGAPGDCPSAERLVQWQDGHLDAAASAQVRHHVAQCSGCRAAWLALVAFDEEDAALSARVESNATAREGRRAWFGWLFPGATGSRTAGPLAAAAVLVLAVAVFVGLPPPGGAPLPEYEVEIEGAGRFRGPAEPGAGPLVLRAGQRLELLLTPATAVDAVLDAGLYAVTGAGGFAALEASQAEVSPAGAVTLSISVAGRLTAAPLVERLVVVVGRAGELPSAGTLARRLAGTTGVTGDGWQAWAVDVEVEGARQPAP